MTDRSPGSLALVAGLFLVLGVLAVLQYRWTGELSDGERERMQRTGEESVRRLSQDFDETIAILASRLRPNPARPEPIETQIIDAVYDMDPARLRLIGNLWILSLESADSPSRLDRETLEWNVADPPDYVVRLQARTPAGGRGFRVQPLLPEVPAIVLPSGQPRSLSQGGSPMGREPGTGPHALVIVELDRTTISRELLPELVRRYFGDDEIRDWSIVVTDRFSNTLVYASDGAAPAGKPDFSSVLLGMQLIDAPQGPDGPVRGPRGPAGQGVAFRGPREDAGRPPPAGAWTVDVRHRGGTLEEAVATSRARNLGLSAAVLLLLLTGGLITIANAHKSRELARQQLEFVAAVTHEINTPIAAISSAGQNLADGLVKESEQVRRYGSMIAREGRRLSTMVDHVLEFAGMQSSSYQIATGPTTVGDIVDHALAWTAWIIEEHGVVVERDVQGAERSIFCDRDALSRALANLLANAIKYRGSSSRIVVTARVDDDRRELELSVSDEGLGLSAEDRKRVFEPFVRGSNVRDGAIRGSGLGLSIVRRIAEAHQGRVTVESTLGRGSRFSILIPVA